MAVDTRDKRMSLLGFGQPLPRVLPNPDGTVGTQDRAMLLWLYHGIALAETAVVYLLDITLSDAAVTTLSVVDAALTTLVLSDAALTSLALSDTTRT